MNSAAAACVYLLCLLASLICTSLLIRAWHRSRSRLLLWTAMGFGFFALNNLALAADMLLVPDMSLWAFRFVPAFIGVTVLLYGFVWETGR
jgi:hypothetical protein